MPSFDLVIMGWLFIVRRACGGAAVGMVGDWDDVEWGKRSRSRCRLR